MKKVIFTTFLFAFVFQIIVNENNVFAQANPKTAKKELGDNNETFSDKSRIGRRGLNRVEIKTFEKSDKSFVKIRFYAKSKSRWVLKSESEIEKFGGLPIEPKIKDYDGDGFEDVTFISDSPARGANEVRALFIYKPKKNDLVYIKNSRDYPNLEHNPLLKGLTSWRFTGSTTTEFLTIKGNKLVEFASVEDRGTERTIIIFDKTGKEKLLRREKRKDDGFDRYINFNPVQKYP
jgi:hypothetical protein